MHVIIKYIIIIISLWGCGEHLEHYDAMPLTTTPQKVINKYLKLTNYLSKHKIILLVFINYYTTTVYSERKRRLAV